MLSPVQIQQRDGKLTASRVACLMTGDETKILNLWREMIGDPAFVPEDLSGVWPVQLGSVTEALNLAWYARKCGPLSRYGEVITHPEHEWAACTLDAWDDGKCCPVEAKHVGGRELLARVIDRYQPQLHWQMIVTNSRRAILSIIEGANEPVCEEIEIHDAYASELWRRAQEFMQCVWTLTPPIALPEVTAPAKPERVYEFTGNNQWASEAVTWLTTRIARKDNEAAEKALKGLVPADAARCHGHGIEIKRDRAGRLSIRELS